MKRLCHNTFDSRFRRPFGAVTPDTPVTLFLEAPAADFARLRVWTDSETLIDGLRTADGWEFTYTPAAAGISWYYFIIDSPDGRRFYGGDHGEGRVYDCEPPSFQLTVYEPWTAPAGYAGKIAYQIFPDRFWGDGLSALDEHLKKGRRVYAHTDRHDLPDYLPRDGAAHYAPVDFFGGTLDGIREKLPYLKALSVGVIYLNPIFESATNHRYATADYMTVDPVLGGEAALTRLVEAARAINIRIMLDGVFSHTGDDSVYFDRYSRYGGGAYSDPASPYRRWYKFDGTGGYASWWGFESLPEVDENDGSYRRFIAAMLKKWASFGLTAWRLDVADELPDGFIEFLRAELKAIDPAAALIGEVWEDASTKLGAEGRRRYTDGRELDGVMNYPLRTAMLDFLLGRLDAAALAHLLTAQKEAYPPPFLNGLLNSLSTHDTVRASTVLSGAPHRDALTREAQAHYVPPYPEHGRRLMEPATVLLMALPGVPCLYYGDEAGMTGMADPFCRGAFPWDGIDGALLDFTRRAAAARAGSREFSAGDAEYSAMGADVIVIRRGDSIAAVNRGANTAELILGGAYRELINGGEYGGSIAVPAMGGVMLEKIYSTLEPNVVY